MGECANAGEDFKAQERSMVVSISYPHSFAQPPWGNQS
jgi:hypothetical protein